MFCEGLKDLENKCVKQRSRLKNVALKKLQPFK